MANRNSRQKSKAAHKVLVALKQANPRFKQLPMVPKKRPGSWHGFAAGKNTTRRTSSNSQFYYHEQGQLHKAG